MRRAKEVQIPLSPSLYLSKDAQNYCRLENGRVLANTIRGRYGASKKGSSLRGIPVKSFSYLDDNNLNHLVVLTTRELYEWNGTDWDIITRCYTDGTVSCSGGTIVTGSGTSWKTEGVPTTGRIKFGVTNPNDSGTWYEIDSVDSDTQLTLKNNGPVVSGSSYVITMSYQVTWGNDNDSIDMCIVEHPGSNWVVVGSNLDKMTRWNGSGQAVEMTGASGISLYPRALVSFMNRLVAIAPREGTTEYWHRYRWTALGSFDDWTSTGSGFEDLFGAARVSRIVGYTVGQSLVLYEHRDSYIVNYVGGTDVFRATVASYDRGITGIRAKVEYPNFVIGLGLRELNKFNYGAVSENLTEAVEVVFTDGAEGYSINCSSGSCGRYSYQGDIGILGIPSCNGCMSLLCMDGNGTPESIWTFPDGISMIGLYSAVDSSGSWDSDDKSWDADVTTWDFMSFELSSSDLIVGTMDGSIYTLDAGADDGANTVFETMAYIPDVAARVNEIRVHVRGKSGGSISLACSYDYGNSWEDLGVKTLSGSDEELSWFPNKWVDSIKIRITAPAYGLRMYKPVMYIIQRRQR